MSDSIFYSGTLKNLSALDKEKLENISENMIVTVDGVCTYVSSDNIRLRGAFMCLEGTDEWN